jgi:hypothetical protein
MYLAGERVCLLSQKRSNFAMTEHKKAMSQVQQLSQQLQQIQSAMAAMQQKAEWKDQQLVLMHEEYNCAIKKHAL